MEYDSELAEPTQKSKVVVLGSLNYDVFLKISRLPKLGETLAAEDDILKAFGGKGANMAVGCVRIADRKCTEVSMLGQVGNDREGEAYLQYLKDNNIESSNVKKINTVTG